MNIISHFVCYGVVMPLPIASTSLVRSSGDTRCLYTRPTILYSSRLKQCEVCKIVVKFCCVELTWGFVLISDTTMHTCCAEKNTNISINGDNDYLPSETGNLTITYDITQAYEGNYWALVCTHSCSLRSHFFWTPTWCFILEPILGFDYYYGKNSAKLLNGLIMYM